MASSSIRQPEDVLVSVASPRAPGRRAVAARAAWKLLAGGTRAEYDQRDGDRQDRGRRGADQDEAARRRRAARTSLRLDARTQAGRRLDPGHGAPRQGDRPLLLGQPFGKLRRRSDLCLERRTTLRRKRAVRERRELGDLLAAVLSSRRRLNTAPRTVTPNPTSKNA